jgi:hypothetical protein
MSYQLTFGGGEAVLVRDTGTANPVQGFVSAEVVVSKNVTALPTNVVFTLIGLIQAPLSAGNQMWFKVAGTWKEVITWLNAGGVWKQTNPQENVSGTWR